MLPEDGLATTKSDPPYWLVNVPRSEWTADCPEFLINTSERDQKILCTPDDQYHRLTWKEVQWIVETDRLDQFTRRPSDLRKYLAYIADLKIRHGSVMKFILDKRLHWTDYTSNDPAPFHNPNTDEIKILYNDWPYGIDERIVHLVVWTKFEIAVDPVTENLTSHARQEIDEYIDRKFRARVPSSNVIWFKNWKSLKSVHAIEHFHVMLFDPNLDFIKEITNGDVPAYQTTV